jgi:uncharacterized protein
MTEKLERRILYRRVDLEHRVGTDYPYIAGLAAVFYRADDEGTEFDIFGDGSVVERIMPSAFHRTLREMDQIGCYNHDPNLLLGRKSAGTMRLGVTELGLHYEITPPDTQAARDLMQSIKRGDVMGSSFSFTPKKGGSRIIPQMNGKTVRELHDVDVFDVGPVATPAYSSTTAGMRALGNVAELRSDCAREAQEAAEIRSPPASVAYAGARARQIEADLGIRADRPSTKVQSVLIPVDKFSEVEAKKWCKDHEFKAADVDKTENFYRFRQFSPDNCKSEPRTITLDEGKGIKAVICQPKGGGA